MTLDHLTRTRRNTLAITLLVTLLALLATGIAVPARAAVAIAVTAANGSVGVPQSLSATVTSSELGSPTGTVSFTVNGQAVGSQGVGGSLGSTATVSWTPTSTGAVTIQARFAGADGTEASDSRTIQVARVDTTAAISAPSSSPASGSVTLTATVTARQGTYQPTGSVTFLRDAGTVIGSGTTRRHRHRHARLHGPGHHRHRARLRVLRRGCGSQRVDVEHPLHQRHLEVDHREPDGAAARLRGEHRSR